MGTYRIHYFDADGNQQSRGPFATQFQAEVIMYELMAAGAREALVTRDPEPRTIYSGGIVYGDDF